MKKSFKMQDLDCANCAAKMENAIGKLAGVDHVSISFMTQKITLEAEEGLFEQVLQEAQKVCSKIERDCRILV